MTGQDLEELLWLEIDGELSAEERQELSARLASDPDARQLADELQAFCGVLERIENVDSPRQLEPRILEALAKKRGASGRLLRFFSPTSSPPAGSDYGKAENQIRIQTSKGGDAMSKIAYVAALISAILGGLIGYNFGQGEDNSAGVDKERLAGTVGAAERYRDDQIGDTDIAFAGEEGADLGSATSPDDPFVAAVNDAFARMPDSQRAEFFRSAELGVQIDALAKMDLEVRQGLAERMSADLKERFAGRSVDLARMYGRMPVDAQRQAFARAGVDFARFSGDAAARADFMRSLPLERRLALRNHLPLGARQELNRQDMDLGRQMLSAMSSAEAARAAGRMPLNNRFLAVRGDLDAQRMFARRLSERLGGGDLGRAAE